MFSHHSQESVQYLNHPSHAKIGIHAFPDKLYVICMLENALRWRARYNNYWKFAAHVEASNAILYTAEIAFGDRKYEITEPTNPRHLQLRTKSELWHKENAFNLLIQRLPSDAKYVAWIDADVSFSRTDWAQETLHLLQHYDVIQMFNYAQCLDKNDNPIITEDENSIFTRPTAVFPGFISAWYDKRTKPHDPKYNINVPVNATGAGYKAGTRQGFWGHPGFAWAWRIDALNKVGGLIDYAILGSSDWHMACGLVGNIEASISSQTLTNYNSMVRQWGLLADKHIQGNVGYMPGLLHHRYHGPNNKRAYVERWKFLTQSGYDPNLDLRRNYQGVYELTERNRILRDGIRSYMRDRDEDS